MSHISLKFSNYLKFIILLSILVSCKNFKNDSLIQENLWSVDVSPEIVKKYNIKSQIKTKVRTDNTEPFIAWSNGTEISPNKILSIKYFNSNGLPSLEVIPTYEWRKNDTTGFSKLSYAEKLFFPDQVETNLPTGFYDSVFYYYNEKGLIIEEERRNTTEYGLSFKMYKIKYQYDTDGNLIQKCSDSDDSANICSYKKYLFDDKGEILSVIDSNSVWLDRPDVSNKGIESKFSYDSNGLISSIGNTFYKYDLNKKMIQKYILHGDVKKEVESYEYDTNGNCVKIERLWEQSSSYNADGSISSIVYDTSLLFKQFDEKGLIVESSYKRSKDQKHYDLYRYTYTY